MNVVNIRGAAACIALMLGPIVVESCNLMHPRWLTPWFRESENFEPIAFAIGLGVIGAFFLVRPMWLKIVLAILYGPLAAAAILFYSVVFNCAVDQACL